MNIRSFGKNIFSGKNKIPIIEVQKVRIKIHLSFSEYHSQSKTFLDQLNKLECSHGVKMEQEI